MVKHPKKNITHLTPVKGRFNYTAGMLRCFLRIMYSMCLCDSTWWMASVVCEINLAECISYCVYHLKEYLSPHPSSWATQDYLDINYDYLLPGELLVYIYLTLREKLCVWMWVCVHLCVCVCVISIIWLLVCYDLFTNLTPRSTQWSGATAASVVRG